MEHFVLALTGPSGAGKSTVGEKVAKSFQRCVNIDADHVKHMIVSGFYKDSSMPGGGGFTEWGLVGDSIGLLAANFLNEGYDVVINGYIDEPAWSNIEKHIKITHKVLLLPELSTVINRDGGRRSDIAMGEASVRPHHNTFSTDTFYESFEKLDTTNHTVEETIDSIRRMISEGPGSVKPA